MRREGSSTVEGLGHADARSWSDRYLLFLICVLAGYALMGKGFAYLGVPPIFIGEITLLLGTLVFLRMGLLFACLTTLPSLILAALMAWTLLRTVPFVRSYGADALRDSVIVMYGAFAYIVIALLLEDARRLDMLLQYYSRFLRFFVPLVPLLFALCQYAQESFLPNLPGTDVPILLLGAGEVPVHLAGAAVFALVGFYRPSALWVVCLVAAVLMASALNRGGMLAFAIPVVAATILTGKTRSLVRLLLAGMIVFGASYAVEKAVTNQSATASKERELRPSQFVENAESIWGHSDPKLEGSRRWRLEWWGLIMKDTLYGGPHFWSGRGFGLNLAVEDGYGGDRQASPLRSPHNAHMTLLARAGVPGLALWILFLMAWLGMMGGAFIDARRRREQAWTGLFLFVACYASAAIINATFDVALEGPMQGIWFWCLIGFGIGAVMIFRFQHRQPFAQRSAP
ncbi:MAG: O-antigen ligase family protein [Variibacter sp.]